MCHKRKEVNNNRGGAGRGRGESGRGGRGNDRGGGRGGRGGRTEESAATETSKPTPGTDKEKLITLLANMQKYIRAAFKAGLYDIKNEEEAKVYRFPKA